VFLSRESSNAPAPAWVVRSIDSLIAGRTLPRVGRSRENRPKNVHAEEMTL
jgi:hypothetical protein